MDLLRSPGPNLHPNIRMKNWRQRTGKGRVGFRVSLSLNFMSQFYRWQQCMAFFFFFLITKLGTVYALPLLGLCGAEDHRVVLCMRDSSSLPLSEVSLLRTRCCSIALQEVLGTIQHIYLCFSSWSHTILPGFYGYAGCFLFRLNEQTIKYPAVQSDLKQW